MPDPFKKLMKELKENGKDCMEQQPKPAAERVKLWDKEIAEQEKWEKEKPAWRVALNDLFGDSAKDMKVKRGEALIDRDEEAINNTLRCAGSFLGTDKPAKQR